MGSDAEILLGDHALTFVEHPIYSLAHPNEPHEDTERCVKCAIGRRQDTGETVLLWQAGGTDWTISRHDPEWQRHRTELFPEGAQR